MDFLVTNAASKNAKKSHYRNIEKVKRFTSIPHIQGVSEPISQIFGSSWYWSGFKTTSHVIFYVSHTKKLY